MSKTFRQYDSRWGRLSYPPGTRSTMASAGCGPTACASIIVNNPKYRNITPRTTRKFMLNGGYVPGGVGTMWSGIDACMKHFGFEVKRHNDMDSFFKEMNKGSRRAMNPVRCWIKRRYHMDIWRSLRTCNRLQEKERQALSVHP